MSLKTPQARFHDGERAVQRRAGTERAAARVGRYVGSTIRADHAEFLQRQQFVVVAGQDSMGRAWASVLVGPAGSVRAVDERRLLLSGQLAEGDPLTVAFESADARIGIIAMEPDSRTRVRINGLGHRTPDGILVTVEESFGNCPKYIQRRLPPGRLEPPKHPSRRREGMALDAGQAELIRAADTLFIASAHPERGADASHRGGRPGFVEVASDGRSLSFPDYSGNSMFQTLGNLTVDPRAGLLVLDWDTGAALQLTGRADISWDHDEIATRPGAERLVNVAIDAVHEQQDAVAAPWTLIEPWRRNPAVN
jgi:predicted pyridoxine 5'-phosphate oxidase superfamily flavin-nucleotide-binding protein